MKRRPHKSYWRHILILDSWHTPATDYPEETVGAMRINRSRYTPGGLYYMWGIDGFYFFQAKHPLPITRLQERRGTQWHDWMVDDPPHWRSMEIYADHSRGNILCAGLGLGLILHTLSRNPLVDSITVVERSADVIALVGKHIPREVEIVRQDFYDFITTSKETYDVVIVDLWVARDSAEKMRLYREQVLPLYVRLRLRYPRAVLIFHGFFSLSDIKVSTLPPLPL